MRDRETIEHLEAQRWLRDQGSAWDRMPRPIQWLVGVGMAVYFGGGLLIGVLLLFRS